jgi:hypothetical protein
MPQNISYMSDEKPLTHENTRRNANIEDIINKDIRSLQSKLKPTNITLYNMYEVYDYLKTQDLRKLLGLPPSGNFYDIFLDEETPSSDIFVSKKGNNHHLYKCHSNRFVGTIIQIVERLQHCSIPEAEDFLMSVYKIELTETELQKQMKKTLDANKRLLKSTELEKMYPSFYKVAKPYLKDLHLLFDMIKENLPNGDNPLVMFYYSLSKVAKYLGIKSKDSASRRLSLFTLLELMFKLDDASIPSDMLLDLQQWQKDNSYPYRSNVYLIPSYSYDMLSQIEEKCKKFIKNGMTMMTISHEGIKRSFSLEEANRVFPQDANKQINELNEVVAQMLEKKMLILIETDGYTTEKRVLEEVTLYFRGQQRFKQEQLKRCLSEIIDKYCLVRVGLNKQLKEQLNFTGKGYPKVIMFADRR